MDKTSTSSCSQEEQTPQTTQSRKRQIDSDSNDEPLAKQYQLTRKNLSLFDKMSQKKASNAAGDLNSTRTTSATTSGFAHKAQNNGIILPRGSKVPKNIEDICKRHAASRGTATPPESVYNDLADRIQAAGNKTTLVLETGKLLKEYPKGYSRAFNRLFTNFPRDVGFNDGLSAPKPDFIEGLEKEEYRPFPVADHIDGAAIYKDAPYSVTLPQIAGEWEGPDGSIGKAELQSAYAGAAMVYVRNKALAFMGKSDPPGHAEVTTFTTDGTNLKMYAHYAIPSEEDEDTLEFHQYQYASTNIRDSYQGHKDGRRGLRNAQDHAMEQSHALRDQLKEHWKKQRSTPHSIVKGIPPPAPDDDTVQGSNAAEDGAGYEVVEQQRCRPTPTPSPKLRKVSRSRRGGRKRGALPQPPHALSRPRRSKAKTYWTLDDESGQYYYQHSNGTISRYVDNDED